LTNSHLFGAVQEPPCNAAAVTVADGVAEWLRWVDESVVEPIADRARAGGRTE
jgi:hypothetical protein